MKAKHLEALEYNQMYRLGQIYLGKSFVGGHVPRLKEAFSKFAGNHDWNWVTDSADRKLMVQLIKTWGKLTNAHIVSEMEHYLKLQQSTVNPDKQVWYAQCVTQLEMLQELRVKYEYQEDPEAGKEPFVQTAPDAARAKIEQGRESGATSALMKVAAGLAVSQGLASNSAIQKAGILY